MFKAIREVWINYRKIKILKEWQYNDAVRRQYYAELFYRTWVSGWLSGWGKGDPEAGWKEMAGFLGIEFPMSETYKEMFKKEGV